MRSDYNVIRVLMSVNGKKSVLCVNSKEMRVFAGRVETMTAVSLLPIKCRGSILAFRPILRMRTGQNVFSKPKVDEMYMIISLCLTSNEVRVDIERYLNRCVI